MENQTRTRVVNGLMKLIIYPLLIGCMIITIIELLRDYFPSGDTYILSVNDIDLTGEKTK